MQEGVVKHPSSRAWLMAFLIFDVATPSFNLVTCIYIPLDLSGTHNTPDIPCSKLVVLLLQLTDPVRVWMSTQSSHQDGLGVNLFIWSWQPITGNFSNRYPWQFSKGKKIDNVPLFLKQDMCKCIILGEPPPPPLKKHTCRGLLDHIRVFIKPWIFCPNQGRLINRSANNFLFTDTLQWCDENRRVSQLTPLYIKELWWEFAAREGEGWFFFCPIW